MTVTGGPKAPINEFSLGDKDAVDKMNLRAQAGLAQNYADGAVALAEAGEKKKKEEEEERKKREAAEIAKIAALNSIDNMLSDIDNIIAAQKERMRQLDETLAQRDNRINTYEQNVLSSRDELRAQGIEIIMRRDLNPNAETDGIVSYDAQTRSFYSTNVVTGERQYLPSNEQRSAQQLRLGGVYKTGDDPAVQAQVGRITQNTHDATMERSLRSFDGALRLQMSFDQDNTKGLQGRLTELRERAKNGEDVAAEIAEAEKQKSELGNSSMVGEVCTTGTTQTTNTSQGPAPAPGELFLKSDARAAVGAEIVMNGSLDDVEREKLANDLGISVEALMALEQDLAKNDYTVMQALEAEKLNADEITMTGMTVSAVESAPTPPGAVPTLSNSVQATVAKANAELERQAPKLEQQQLEPKTFSPTMGA